LRRCEKRSKITINSEQNKNRNNMTSTIREASKDPVNKYPILMTSSTGSNLVVYVVSESTAIVIHQGESDWKRGSVFPEFLIVSLDPFDGIIELSN
jgi:hypothetical protein